MFRMNALTKQRVFIIGCVLVVVGIILSVVSITKISAYKKVEALVVEVKTVKPNNSEDTNDHYATFSYEVNGIKYTARAELKGLDLFKAKQGSNMKIYYDPKNPNRVTTGGNLLTYAIVAAAAGAVCVLLSLTART